MACGGIPTTETPEESPTATNSEPETRAADPAAVSQMPAQAIATTALTSEPIRMTADDLPEPYTSDSASQSPNVVPVPENPTLSVPAGFTVNVYADGLDQPRWLALTPEGDVLVTETRQNRIRRLSDTDDDGVADDISTFADSSHGLNIPFGMAFSADAFFLGNTDAVVKFPYQSGQGALEGTGTVIAELPGEGYRQHWTRNVVVSPAGDRLYVSIGSESNASEEPLPRASVQVMNLDGSNQETFAYGLRNPVGLDFHPETEALYTTVNERDGLGDDLVPDYLTRLQKRGILRLALRLPVAQFARSATVGGRSQQAPRTGSPDPNPRRVVSSALSRIGTAVLRRRYLPRNLSQRRICGLSWLVESQPGHRLQAGLRAL